MKMLGPFFTPLQCKSTMFGINPKWALVPIMLLVPLSELWCQSVTGGYVSPPKQFTQFLDGDFAASFGESAGGGCDLNLKGRSSQLEWGVTGKWKVYTVRENTPLYVEESNFSSSSPIDFRTALSVLEVGKSMLRVEFVDRRGGREGWVEACDVLMWNKPIARNGGFPRRVVALSQIERNGTEAKVVETNFSRDPSSRGKRADLITGLEVLYIMKEVAGSDGKKYFLLSGSANSSDLSVDLKGWLPANQVTAWDTRVAYWENHSNKSQQEYAGQEVALFYTEEDLVEFSNTQQLRNALKKTSLERKPKSLNRMLHLESSWNQADVGRSELLELFAVMNSSESNITKGERNKKIAEFRKKMMQFNIHFVIDATASMEKNVPAIRAGLTEFMHELTSGSLRPLLEKITVSVGASVYRGVEDGEDVYDCVVEPMSIKDNSGIQAFDKKISKIEFTSDTSDYTLEESMFWGISESLLDADFEPGATNFLIVIGDAGDDGKTISGQNAPIQRSEVLAKLKDGDVDLLVLQSTNGYHRAFDSYVRDALYFIDNLESEDGELSESADPSLPFWSFISTGESLETSLKNEGLLCVNTNTGSRLESALLGQIIASRIDSAAVRNYTRQREFVQRLKNDDTIPEDFYPPGVPKAPPEQEYSVRAWANRSYYGNSQPAFVPYVYMENDVFEDFKGNISRLTGLDATAFYKELERFLAKYSSKILGLGKSHPSVLNMTMSEVWDEAFDLPFAYDKLGEVKIKEIQGLNSATVAGDRLKNQIEDFQYACRMFSNIEKDDYQFFTSWDNSSIGGVVYWIPGDQFPGMNPR